jgi:hypothetical protein
MFKKRTPKHNVRASHEQEADSPSGEAGFNKMPNTGSKQIYEGHWEHEFPCKIHQLIHSQTGQGSPNPDEQSDEAQELRKKPEVRWYPGQKWERRAPTTEE